MVKHKIEALLFSSGRKMSIEEISKLCKQKADAVLAALKELQKDYEQRKSSLMLIEEGNYWKITVREQHLSLVSKIVAETELSKSVIETLAVIAFKYPILQSKLIQIRTNKAYDHLRELEDSGYITRQKRGRTKIIKLTQKFFDYFSLPEEQLKEQFKDFESIAKAIEEKEIESDKLKAEQKQGAEDAKKLDEKIREEAGKLDEEEPLEKLEVFDAADEKKESPEAEENRESEPAQYGIKEPESGETEKPQEPKGEPTANDEEPKEEQPPAKENEDKVEKEIEKMIRPQQESCDDALIKKEFEKEKGKEPKDILEAAMEETKDKGQ